MDRAERAMTVCLVIPCYNEHERIVVDDVRNLASDERVSVILVDDGSVDGTEQTLESLAATCSRVRVLVLGYNGGKGEAVRQGMLQAARCEHEWIGFADADFATPVEEILRMVDVAGASAGIEVLIGSRVALLGRSITRSAFRHYTGRIFATIASLVLGKPVYDTQCGMKLFRTGPSLDRALESPFRSRWAFDVELLGRLDGEGVEPGAFWEEPLQVWHDAAGSRRSVRDSVRATGELLPIWLDLRRRRP